MNNDACKKYSRKKSQLQENWIKWTLFVDISMLWKLHWAHADLPFLWQQCIFSWNFLLKIIIPRVSMQYELQRRKDLKPICIRFELQQKNALKLISKTFLRIGYSIENWNRNGNEFLKRLHCRVVVSFLLLSQFPTVFFMPGAHKFVCFDFQFLKWAEAN